MTALCYRLRRIQTALKMFFNNNFIISDVKCIVYVTLHVKMKLSDMTTLCYRLSRTRAVRQMPGAGLRTTWAIS